MCFRCEDCKKTVHGAPIKVVTKTRPMIYTGETFLVQGKPVTTKGGVGWEIVKEKQLCDKCANKYGEVIIDVSK